MKKLPFALFISGLTGILLLGTVWTSDVQAGSKRNFTLEVSMDPETRGINPPLMGGPNPPKGIIVIVNGNIYPEGTLSPGIGPDLDGAIGTWRCHFAGLGEIDLPLTGAVTYYFQLNSTGYDHESMIIVQGLNSHLDPVQSVRRVLAVVGGTGRYARVRGEVLEEVTSENSVGARNLRFRFRLRNVRSHHHDDWDDD